MNVVQLGKYRNKDMGVVLKYLLNRWERGELRGLAVCGKTSHGQEEITFTGDYRDDPAHALSAALKMSRRINQLQDEQESL